MTESPDRSPWWDWEQWTGGFDDEVREAIAENVEAQSRFVDAWASAVGTAAEDDSAPREMQGSLRAYEAWMEAAAEAFDSAGDAVEGEDVPVERFRDLWLTHANQAFKEVVTTAAFAETSGQTLEELLELGTELDETAESALHEAGFATSDDVREVGDRLLELERRQHDVETKLDRVLDALDE